MNPLAWLATTLVDVVYPERCFLCGAGHGELPWSPPGPRVPGFRFWDGTHLCRACSRGLDAPTVIGRVGPGREGCLTVVSACHTHSELVKLVGGLKYHGLRGLAWPLSRLMTAPLERMQSEEPVVGLVPVPLHGRRRRVRGFNQAEILTRLLSRESGLPVIDDILVRRRNTGQQAKIKDPESRRQNLANSFRAKPPRGVEGASGEAPVRIGLVDDLVTSGWTTVMAAAALRAAGWEVSWVLALGLAAHSRNSTRRVDTWNDGF